MVLSLKTFFNERTERERDRANSRSVCHSYPPFFSENKQAIAYNVFIVYCPIFFFLKEIYFPILNSLTNGAFEIFKSSYTNVYNVVHIISYHYIIYYILLYNKICS